MSAKMQRLCVDVEWAIRFVTRRRFLWTNDLERLIPTSGREEKWRELGELLKCKLPELEMWPDEITIPSECQTIELLSLWIAAENPQRLRWTRQEIYDEVQDVLIKSLGVDEDEVTPDASFADLGID